MGDFGCAFCVSRQAAPSRGSWWGGRRFAPTPLRCSAWGRAAQLATFAGLTALGQVRRVSPRCALRAPTPASSPRRPTNRPCRVPPAAKSNCVVFECEDHCSAKSRPGRWQRACGAPRSTGFVARARSAPRNLICRTLFERSERSDAAVVRRATRPSTAGQSVRSTGRCAEALPPARVRLCCGTVGQLEDVRHLAHSRRRQHEDHLQPASGPMGLTRWTAPNASTRSKC